MSRALAAFLALAAACTTAAGADTVRVSAAASLTEAFGEIARAYEAAHPGAAVELNFAGSQVLRAQVEQGAPVDVFASADLAHAEALARAGLLAPPRVFARNRLVVAVPAARARVARLQDLAEPGTRIVLSAPTVPAGAYTAQALGRLAATGLFGGDFEARVQANVVSREANVRVALARVALGEADAAFVYATDAAALGGKVRALEIPARANVVAEYPIGVVAASARRAKAEAFVDFVLAAPGQAILRAHGFGR
jgi:molybdate transport system substrate-binding protein